MLKLSHGSYTAALLSLLLLIGFQNCTQGFLANSDLPLPSETSLSSTSFLMDRPAFSTMKVGVLYTPYSKVSLGYDGSRFPWYNTDTIHKSKSKPLRDWSAPGSVMISEMPWLGTLNIEAQSEANPYVAELPKDTVSKYHAKWLQSMGADFIIWDATNHAWVENTVSDNSQAMVVDTLRVHLESWLQLRQQGVQTPQVAIWVPIPKLKRGTYVIHKLLEIIDNPRYEQLIFKYQGKPLVIIVSSRNPDMLAIGASNNYFYEPDQTILNSLKAKYTVREMWANEQPGSSSPNWSYLQNCVGYGSSSLTPYTQNGTPCNQRVSPAPLGADPIEQIPVTLAYARDHISNRQSATPKMRGYTLLRQLETVFNRRQDVDIVTISSFNTWAAARMNPICIPDHPTGLYQCINQNGLDYYRNAVALKNDPLNTATPAFTDDFDEEYGVTFEPGGVTGDYYLRLVNRALKKISEGRNPMEAYDAQALTIKGFLHTNFVNSTLDGWACLKGSSNSILVSIRSGNTEVARVRADQDLSGAHGDAVQAECDSSRRRHGFILTLSAQQLQSLQGQRLTAVGISESEYFDNGELNGTLLIPNGQVCSPNSSTTCPITNGSGQKTCDSAGSGYGSCTATSCNPGYTLSNGQCVMQSAGPIMGFVDEVKESDGKLLIRGWSCSTGYEPGVAVHLYAGGPAGSGVLVLGIAAEVQREAGVGVSCKTSSSKHGYEIRLTPEQRDAFKGKAIFIHGIHPSLNGNNPTLNNSGKFFIY